MTGKSAVRGALAAAALSLCWSLAAASPEAAIPPALDVLNPDDEARYRDIFELQEDGRWGEADKLIAQLNDDVLMGYVLRQRYLHPTAYRSTYDELKRWMSFYADYPQADEIYDLAMKRRPKKAAPPVRPAARKWRSPVEEYALHPALKADYAATSRPRLSQIEGRVRHLTKQEQASTAQKEIDAHLKRGVITERQYDRMRSWIAASYYYQGYIDTAQSLAEEAAARSGDSAVLAHWIAGLVAFRRDDFARAHDHFEAQAKSPYQEDALRSAAGFWAARAALAARLAQDVAPNLEIAAQFPYTFYGQLALSQLGRNQKFNWTPPQATAQGFAALAAVAPSVKRAVALAEAGDFADADLELRWANGMIDPPYDRELLAVAAALDLPAAQIDIALSGKADYLEAGLFPIPKFAPKSGFKTDRALLYALMRQESKFKTEATSRVGARGLMQLMPKTASYMAGDKSLRKGKGRERLYDPAYNLDLGQSYVNHLIQASSGGDLFDVAVAYNGGPGNLRRWKRDAGVDDPLLFIESIPNPESRDFVEKVLTNFWIYRARLGQPAPERDRVAAGELPLYEALDEIVEDAAP